MIFNLVKEGRKPLFFKLFFQFSCLALLLFTLSCSTTKTKTYTLLELKPVDSLEIELPYAYKVYSTLGFQHIIIEDSNYLVFADMQKDFILEINLDRNSNHLAKMTALPQSYNYKYKIFQVNKTAKGDYLICEDIGNFRGRNQDSTFSLFNIRNLQSTPVYLTKSPLTLNRRDSNAVYYAHKFKHWHFWGDSLFIPLNARITASEKTERELKIPQFAMLVLQGDSLLNYNELKVERPNPSEFKFSEGQGVGFINPIDNKTVSIAYANRPEFYLFDLENQTITAVSDTMGSWVPKPVAIDTSQRDLGIAANPISSEYLQVLHDSVNNQYLRMAVMPYREVPKNANEYWEYANHNQWMGLYSSDLELLAQGIKPPRVKRYGAEPIFVNGLLVTEKESDNFKIIFNEVKTREVTKAEFDSVGLVLQNTRENFEAKRINTLKSYLSGLGPEIANKVLLIVPKNACPTCANYAIEYAARSLKDTLAKHKFIFITDDNKLEKVLSPTELRSNRVYYETSNKLSKSIDYTINNPTVLFWTGKSIKAKMVLNPSDIADLEVYLTAFDKFTKN
jgi:hypothetical protein